MKKELIYAIVLLHFLPAKLYKSSEIISVKNYNHLFLNPVLNFFILNNKKNPIIHSSYYFKKTSLEQNNKFYPRELFLLRLFGKIERK